MCKQGRKYGVSELTFFILTRAAFINVGPRFTVVVGSSVSKKAVVRNRLKRQIRDVIRRAILVGALAGAVDVVIIVRPPFVAVPDKERVAFVEKLLFNLRLVQKV